MKRSLAALPLCLAAACATAPRAVAPPGTVALGQHVHVGRFIVSPISIYEDSRCPSGVRCIYAGRLVVFAQVDGPKLREVHDFMLGVPVTVGDSSITLASASPERFAAVALRPQDYRFTFEGGR